MRIGRPPGPDRRFLKELELSSQRAIAIVVRRGMKQGQLTGDERLRARETVTLEGVDLKHVMEGGTVLT